MGRLDIGLTAEAFDRRLDPASAAPIAVACSGGGDSLAALLITRAWAERHGRRVLALSVDHGLQAESAAWAAFVASAARRIGADFQPLCWDGAKPAHGLPAAARAARHRLIAEAARAAGARVVVFGHTADDALEAALMRADGLRLGSLRAWSPSPVWPEGRGLFLLRPLLGTRRAAIREALSAGGWSWIDDPANVDLAAPRARARARLAGAGTPLEADAEHPALADLARAVAASPDGALRIDRDRLRTAPAAVARRLLAAAALSVGGGARPPRGERIDRLLGLALGAGPFQATLAGSRIVGADDLLMARDAGEARRGGLAPISLRPGVPVVWDGRFELTAGQDGLSVRAMAGLAAGLDDAQRRALRAVPALARPALPVLIGPGEPSFCPILACTPSVHVRSLVADRFIAACGAISKEPAT